MTKKALVLSGVALVLALVYALYFTDWFRQPAIQIVPMVRPDARRAGAGPAKVHPVAFKFDTRYRFTSIQVVAAADLATNRHPYPLWHLISDTHSTPVDSFIYGDRIRGMKPAIPGTAPEPLEPGVQYVLQVVAESGRYKGQTNFMTRAVR